MRGADNVALFWTLAEKYLGLGQGSAASRNPTWDYCIRQPSTDIWLLSRLGNIWNGMQERSQKPGTCQRGICFIGSML